jgi:hypothetical protein
MPAPTVVTYWQDTKKIYLSKKEIGKYDDKECHLLSDYNFYELPKKPVPLVYAIDELWWG